MWIAMLLLGLGGFSLLYGLVNIIAEQDKDVT